MGTKQNQNCETPIGHNETGDQWKILNGHCVPISTPDDYFLQSARKWLVNHRNLVQAGIDLQRSNLEREQARNEYEEQS